MSATAAEQGRRPSRLAVLLLLMLMVVPTVPLAIAQFTVVPSGRSAPAPDLAESVSSCLSGASKLTPAQTRVAFLVPSFTMTPYGSFDHSFYAFYTKYRGAVGNITHNLEWLSTRVSADWKAPGVEGEMPLHDFLVSKIPLRCGLVLGQNFWFTDDVAVDGGALFAGGHRRYDVLILGHEEYVTRAEYSQLKEFVASGGRLVVMSGNTFWGEVKYDRTTGTETFVIGHGFGYNGKTAWRTSAAPFDSDAAGWFGSTFAEGIYNIKGAVLVSSSNIGGAIEATTGRAEIFTYNWPHDEVNYLRNLTDTEIIARFYALAHDQGGQRYYIYPSAPVDAYAHLYGKGEVVCIGVFGESLISHDRAAQFFLIYATEAGSLTGRWESMMD